MGRYVIVGGSLGIGLSAATQLKAGNHEIHVISRNKDELPDESGFFHYSCDITDETPSFPPLEGAIDGLVYMPGTLCLKPFDQIDIDEYTRDFSIHVLGALKAIKAYQRNLLETGNSAIVLMSTVAVQTGFPFHTSIAAAKGAIEGITRSLAAEFAPKIRVNAIAPTIVNSTLAAPLLDTEEKRQKMADRHPLKRIVSREDVASTISYLLTQPTITGQIIHLDAGISSIAK